MRSRVRHAVLNSQGKHRKWSWQPLLAALISSRIGKEIYTRNAPGFASTASRAVMSRRLHLLIVSVFSGTSVAATVPMTTGWTNPGGIAIGIFSGAEAACKGYPPFNYVFDPNIHSSWYDFRYTLPNLVYPESRDCLFQVTPIPTSPPHNEPYRFFTAEPIKADVPSTGCPVGRSCKQPPQCTTRHPISIGTGNKYLIDTDVSVGGPNVRRSYNATNTEALFGTLLTGSSVLSMPFGWGWTFLPRVQTPDTTTVAWSIRPDGRIYTWQYVATDGWAGDADVNDRLVEIKDTSGVRTGWRYQSADERHSEIYDATGLLQSIVSTTGVRTTLFYSDGSNGSISGLGGFVLDAASGNPTATALPAGRLLFLADDFGRRLQFGYDSNGHIVQIATSSGHILRYSYDVAGNLGKVVYPDNSSKTYLYGEDNHTGGVTQSHALTGVVDENGVRYASYWYDPNGRATSEKLAENTLLDVDATHLAYTLDANGGVTATTVTDPLGSNRTYTFQSIHGVSKNTSLSQPAGSGCGPASAATSYDGNGNVARRTDFNGVVTTYTHDLARNLETQRIEAAGTPEARTVSTRWHPDWRLATRIAEPKKITTHLYNGQPDPDNADAIVTCAPADALVIDKPIAVLCQTTEQATTDPDGSQGFAAPASGAPRIWRFTYNRYGQPLAIDGPRTDIADITTHDYWPIDAACPGAELGTGRDKGCRGQLRQSTDPLGHITRYTRYNALGQLEESIDPNGLVTTQTWDLRQRLTRRTVGDESTAWTYDPAGQLKRLTQPDGNWIDHTYDDAHRLIRIADKAGNRIDYTLDPAGNRIGEDVLDPAGTLSTTLTRSYDALGRIQALSGARQP